MSCVCPLAVLFRSWTFGSKSDVCQIFMDHWVSPCVLFMTCFTRTAPQVPSSNLVVLTLAPAKGNVRLLLIAALSIEEKENKGLVEIYISN